MVEKYLDEYFIPNPVGNGRGLAYFPRGFDPGKRACPGCKHGENLHVAAICYACGHCGWSLLGEGNSRGLPAGWHNTAKYDSDAYDEVEDKAGEGRKIWRSIVGVRVPR